MGGNRFQGKQREVFHNKGVNCVKRQQRVASYAKDWRQNAKKIVKNETKNARIVEKANSVDNPSEAVRVCDSACCGDCDSDCDSACDSACCGDCISDYGWLALLPTKKKTKTKTRTRTRNLMP